MAKKRRTRGQKQDLMTVGIIELDCHTTKTTMANKIHRINNNRQLVKDIENYLKRKLKDHGLEVSRFRVETELTEL